MTTKKQLEKLDDLFKNLNYTIKAPTKHNTLFNADVLDDEGAIKVNAKYEDELDSFINYLKDLDSKDTSNMSVDELANALEDVRLQCLDKFINKISTQLIDLEDEDVKNREIDLNANRITALQLNAITKYGLNKFINADLDLLNGELELYMQIDLLKKVQAKVRDNQDKLNKQDIDNAIDVNYIYLTIYNIQNEIYTKKVNDLYNKFKDRFKTIHNKYVETRQLLTNIVEKWQNAIYELKNDAFYIDEYNNKLNIVNSVKPKTPASKQTSLYATKMFNTTYKGKKPTIINLHNNDYSVKMQLVIDEINDLRDIVLYDEIKNEVISLYPIDLALFTAFTNISSINGNNIPITLNDAIKYIAEDSKLKIKKDNKQIKLFEDRLLLFNNTKVMAQIIKKNSNNEKYILLETKDPISILENNRVFINDRQDVGYIIGASAILTIINKLSEDSGINYLMSYDTQKKLINDGQSNTMAIINMKYYILVKVMQRLNSYKTDSVYQDKINLNDLYKQNAELSNKKELTSKEKQRVREQIEKFINHLSKKLGYNFDIDYMTADGKIIKSKADSKGLTKPITHLLLKINKSLEIDTKK